MSAILVLPDELARLHAIEAVALDYAAWCAVSDHEDAGGSMCACGTCTSCRFLPLLGKARILQRMKEVIK